MLLTGCDSGGTGNGGALGIVELPVAFNISNTNTSGLPCPSDGAAYVVRGYLYGAEAALSRSGAPALTVYLYGFDEGSWVWRMDLAGYHHGAEMAAAGHVSLVLDLLGYDSSDHPDGFQACWGSQADVIHQIIGQLRGGDYSLLGRTPIAFSRIALAGTDIGGAIAQIEAYSYKDLDALIVMIWADQGFTPYLFSLIPEAIRLCGTGGEPAEPAEDGSPGGYFRLGGSDEEYRRNEFPNVADEVGDAILRLRNRNPCGYALSAFPAIATDPARLGEIEIPVLLLYPTSSRSFRARAASNRLATTAAPTT